MLYFVFHKLSNLQPTELIWAVCFINFPILLPTPNSHLSRAQIVSGTGQTDLSFFCLSSAWLLAQLLVGVGCNDDGDDDDNDDGWYYYY